MSSSGQRQPFGDDLSTEEQVDARDRDARARAVDPHFNVALEASAGTGKTRVLVDRYINLLRAGVDPANILALTFTRKAAGEMRDRIVATLRAAAAEGNIAPLRWRELRDRAGDINVCTIDAFCLSLLREFPLEADLDPGFAVADDMEVPRLVEESLDRALRICRALARDDEAVALVFAQLGERRARAGLAALLDRRLVAASVLDRFLARGPRHLDAATAAAAAATALASVFAAMPGGMDRFLETGPPQPRFLVLARRLASLAASRAQGAPLAPAAVYAMFAAVREYFLTNDGKPRSRLTVPRSQFASDETWRAHRDLVVGRGADVLRVWEEFRRDLNVIVARGVRRMFAVAAAEYRRTLDAHAVLDFPDVLHTTLRLLRQMEEFAQSRYRLEARYHHVLVDEFQDTSRAQWELVSLLIASWREGAGLADSGPLHPSVFIVGDAKQSIYGFRDADVSVLREAARHLEALRPGGDVRRSISRSFRAVPQLLSFINDVCGELASPSVRRDAFRYESDDRFPLGAVEATGDTVLSLVPGDDVAACAELSAREIRRLVEQRGTIRDRQTGVHRTIRPGDVAILFRTRDSHREFEEALARHGVPSYVYKGLGFFDADEVKDVVALVRYLGEPTSNLRAAALLRSGFGRLSDEGLRRLAPRLADALFPDGASSDTVLDPDDRAAIALVRSSLERWRGLVDLLLPAELLDLILHESAYAAELEGPRAAQARENVKKLRALVRRIQNRGYATIARIADHLDRLAVGDEPNAVIDALDAVTLMTIHAAKGLEFPVVFVVNLTRGTGNRRASIRLSGAWDGETSVSVGDYRGDDDDDDSGREREETKRLLYVALTRARDRLYLSSVIKEGVAQPGRGSLAEILPARLLTIFAAARPGEPIHWSGASGAHTFNVVGFGENKGFASASCDMQGGSTSEISDVGPIEDGAPDRTSAAQFVGTETSVTDVRDAHAASDLLTGRLVHRLLQRFGFAANMDGEQRLAALSHLVRKDERLDVTADPALLRRAAERFQHLCERSDIRRVFDSGEAFHEVPFTLSTDCGIVRGTIDCLVGRDDGSICVLEFKTGLAREAHALQAELYRRAVATVFPDRRVEVEIVYALEPAPSAP